MKNLVIKTLAALLVPVIAVLLPVAMIVMLLTDKELARQYDYDNGGGEIDTPVAK